MSSFAQSKEPLKGRIQLGLVLKELQGNMLSLSVYSTYRRYDMMAMGLLITCQLDYKHTVYILDSLLVVICGNI